ncbi:MAG: hypothetical protein WC856_24395 [Methylococcaceae bacterium]
MLGRLSELYSRHQHYEKLSDQSDKQRSVNLYTAKSLFNDEGFGSLDPESLYITIASLNTLKALGKKVDVISHEPTLVERNGAKMMIEKQGAGWSSVMITGGCWGDWQ